MTDTIAVEIVNASMLRRAIGVCAGFMGDRYEAVWVECEGRKADVLATNGVRLVRYGIPLENDVPPTTIVIPKHDLQALRGFLKMAGIGTLDIKVGPTWVGYASGPKKLMLERVPQDVPQWRANVVGKHVPGPGVALSLGELRAALAALPDMGFTLRLPAGDGQAVHLYSAQTHEVEAWLMPMTSNERGVLNLREPIRG